MLKPPCKNCPDKHYLCHAECDKYLAYKIVNDIYRERDIKERKLDADLWASSRYSKKKRRKPYAD